MLQLQQLRQNRDEVIRRLGKRNFDATAAIDEILKMDEERRSAQTQMDGILADINLLSRQVGELMKAGKAVEATVMREQSSELKARVQELRDRMQEAETAIDQKLWQIPNAPNDIVPSGRSAEDNELVFSHGQVSLQSGFAKPHWELAADYKLIDFDLGAKITGAGFPVYTGKGARLQRGLINFFLDEAQKAGYSEVIPPHMVNEASGFGTGQLPDKEGQMYHAAADGLYLIPTAEVPVTNIFRDVILKEEELPLKLCAYSPCFRREAGSYGKDVRGLNRLHQFDKVEIVQIEHPDRSYQTLDTMVEHVKSLLIKLGLPFRVLRLCGGDMGFTSALTYDLEVYSGAQERWLEVSSVSNFETYQSNRLKCRYRNAEGKPQLVHTLNGSALALPRIVAALLENNQGPEGIVIPEVLVPYTGFNLITA